MSIRLDGRQTARHITLQLQKTVSELTALGHRPPGLGIIQVGNDPASSVYVKNKLLTARETGIKTFYLRPAPQPEALYEAIDRLNADGEVDGFIVQLPLPSGWDVQAVMERIRPDKDADGFHPLNLGRLLAGRPYIVPATPGGILRLLEHYGISPAGKHMVIAGRSNIVGKPLAVWAASNHPGGNATVTLIHSRTPEPEKLIRTADIFVSAIGKPKYWPASVIKEGAVVIDVGINRDRDGQLCGDIDPEGLDRKAYAYTPVPGGVGPMTVAMLLYNTVELYKQHIAPL